MKKLGIGVFILIGGVLGFGAHLFWHASVGLNLFSSGSHMIQGVVFTLSGIAVGAIFHLILSKA